MPTQPNIDSLREDTEETMSEFVRSDVSIAVIVSLVFGGIAGAVIHWTMFLFMLILAYMLVGLSVTWEWNQRLQEEGMVSRMPFSNVSATAFIPTILVVVVLHFNGVPFGLSAPLSLVVLIGYQFSLYAVGFRGIDSDDVYFKRDPFEGDKRVFKEEVYIPRLEERSMQKARENREADE